MLLQSVWESTTSLSINYTNELFTVWLVNFNFERPSISGKTIFSQRWALFWKISQFLFLHLEMRKLRVTVVAY